MAVVVKNIIPRKQAEAAQTDQYIADGVDTIIDKFTATNTTSFNTTLTVNLIAEGGSAGDENTVTYQKTIISGRTEMFPELIGQVIESGGVISTIAGTASALTISASGREISD